MEACSDLTLKSREPHVFISSPRRLIQNTAFRLSSSHVFDLVGQSAFIWSFLCATASVALGTALTPRKHLVAHKTDRRGDVNGKASVAGIGCGEGQTVEDS